MADDAAIDPQALARLRRLGGIDLVDRMIAMFLENAPDRLARARRGAEDGDAGAVERATHSLKSMAANVGALRLYALAESVEVAAASGRWDDSSIASLAEEFEIVRVALEDWKGESE